MKKLSRTISILIVLVLFGVTLTAVVLPIIPPWKLISLWSKLLMNPL